MAPENTRPGLDQPLGLDRASTARRPRGGLARRGFLVALGLGVLAVSTAVSLREHPFRPPSQAVVAVAVEPEQPVVRTPARPPSQQPLGGPSIIRVPPAADGQGGIVIRDPSALTQDLRVAHLPDPAMLEDSETGRLPVRAADGRRPFDVYARPWSGARGARVAIVIGGLAVSQSGTQTAIERLPEEVTLAFASGGNSIDRWMQEARRKGHEIVLQVPLEPFDYPSVDPGRNTLTVDGGPEENIERLHSVLGRTTNYTGVMNYMGARFLGDRQAVEPVMRELSTRGLMFLDDGSTARSVALEAAATAGAPHAAADIVIDEVRERGDVLAKLDDLERTARAKGYAVGVGSAFDVTVDAVATWVAEARRRGLEIVPVSAVAEDPERR